VYGTGEDALGPDLVAALGALIAGYFVTSWQKVKPNNPWPIAAEGGALAVGAATRRMTRRPYLQAIAEGLEYGSAFGIGQWIGAATTTLGHSAPGAVQPWLPSVPAAGTPASGTTTDVVTAAAPDVAAEALVAPLPASSGGGTLYQFRRRRTAY